MSNGRLGRVETLGEMSRKPWIDCDAFQCPSSQIADAMAAR